MLRHVSQGQSDCHARVADDHGLGPQRALHEHAGGSSCHLLRDCDASNLFSQGSFDDCQALVKAAFADKQFRAEVQLGAVNSINWARILAQITYYFHSYLKVVATRRAETGSASLPEINFAVPTGNFGDILAGYYAKRMGLPVGRLVVCTNNNDVLHRFLTTGVYRKVAAVETLAPSMDISVSSNFERYLYHLSGDCSETLAPWMTEFETTGEFAVPPHLLARAREDFSSHSSSDEEILSTIAETMSAHQYLVCPHTATAVAAVKALGMCPATTVVLATAHPMKFEEAVGRALASSSLSAAEVSQALVRPYELEKVHHLPVRKVLVPCDMAVVKSFVLQKVAAASSPSDKLVSTWNVTAVLATMAAAAGIAALVWRSSKR